MVKINKKLITTISDKGVDGLYTITMVDGSKIKCTEAEQSEITQDSTDFIEIR